MNTDRVRILVVDDMHDAADTMAELLRFSGYDVWTASSAAQALALTEAHTPHCVLFDVVMPGMGGDELCSRLRARYGDDIVLVAVSGCDEGDPRVDKSYLLADHFLTKPVEPAVLARLPPPMA